MENNLIVSKGQSLIHAVPLAPVSSTPLILAAAELEALIKDQAMAMVKRLNKKTRKQRRFAAESDLEGDSDDSDDDDDDGDTGDANSDEDSDNDSSPYAWIGRWVQKPKGERCRNSKDGREGFTTARLLKQARISKAQYGMYKVHLQSIFCRTTDSPQQSAHQLIGRYFDTTKNFRVNMQGHPDGWMLIIEKVCSVQFLFHVSTLRADEKASPTLPLARQELGA